MHEFIPTVDDVLAIRMGGKVMSDDLAAIMARLEPMLEGDRKVHVYVETRSIDGFEISGLASYTARAMPLFGKLRRFGRVAVVADQAWVRFWTRLESALLPFISYRTFTPDEREAALAWVESGSNGSDC